MDPDLVDNDEVKTIEERESDGGEEIEKKDSIEGADEVVEESESGEKEVGIDQEVGLLESSLEKMEGVVETIIEEVKEEIESFTESKDSPVEDSVIENGISNGVGGGGDEVVEVVEEKRELSELDENSVIESSAVDDDEVVKPAEFVVEEVVDVPPGASIEEVLDLIEEKIVGDESLKQVIAPIEETDSIPVEAPEIADAVESEVKENGVEVPPIPTDLPTEEIEREASAPVVVEDAIRSSDVVDLSESTNGDKLAESSVVDDVKVLEIDEQSESKVIEPVVEASTGVVDVAEEVSEVKVDAPVVDPSPEAESGAELKIQENSEEQTDAVATVESREVGDVKNLEVPDSSEKEPLLSTAPLAVRRTAWWNCCGLAELFTRAGR